MCNRSFNQVGGCFMVLGAIALSCSSMSAPDETSANGGTSSVENNEGGKTSAAGTKDNGTAGKSQTGSGGSDGSGGASVKNGGGFGTGGKGSGEADASAGKGGKGGASTGGSTSGTGGKRDAGRDAATGGKGGKSGVPDAGRPPADGSGTGSGGSNADEGGTTNANGDPVKSPGCGKAPALKTGDGQTIAISGTDRTFNLKIPDDYDNNHPYRLIVSYHWLGGTANDVSKGGVAKPYYGLWDLAGGSTIFVAPQGTSNQWGNSGGVDVEFSRQLIAKLEDGLCVDSSRIFCEGFSMGGSMSYAMACAMPEKIRGVAVHSGGSMSGCAKHDKPVAFFMTHGTNDSVCKYPSFPIPLLKDFGKLNGCKTPDPTLSADAFEKALPEPKSSAAACMDFEGCSEEHPVRSCLFVGDHTPSPDGTNGWVPKESWKFISQF